MSSSERRVAVACGVDVGSTNTKVVMIDRDGVVVSRSSCPTPRDSTDKSIVADRLRDAIEVMIIRSCADRYEVAAVAIAGVGEDGILVDIAMRPLVPALAWFDPRRQAVLQEMTEELEPVLDLPVETDASRTVVGWRWAAHQPHAARAVAWLALTDYASSVWAGRAFMSDTLAARTAAWVPGHRSWVGSRVDVSLGDRQLLPEVMHSGEPVGALRSARLLDSGVVAKDAVVVAGGHDHPIGGWGVHRLRPGAVLDSMGTAEVVVGQSSSAHHRHDGMDVAPGIRHPGTTLLSVQELARNWDWVAREPAVGEALRAIIDGRLAPDGGALLSRTFLPGSTGGAVPRWLLNAPSEPRSRASAAIGALAMMGERAVLGICSEMRTEPQVFAAGGWSRSPGWIEAKNRVTGRSVSLLPEPEVTAVGAALLAAEAIAWAADPLAALGTPTST